MDEARLGYCQGDAAGGDKAGHARDVHDATLVLPLKVRSCRPSHEKGTAKIRIQSSIPNLGREPIEIGKRYRVVPGCVVDQDVEAAECLNRLFDGVGTRSGVSLIQLYDESSTPFFLDLLAQVESFVAVAEMSHADMHTMISEHPRGHCAKTATPTGNQSDAITQIHNDASCQPSIKVFCRPTIPLQPPPQFLAVGRVHASG